MTSYAGQDVLLSMTFLTSGGVPAQPTSISYRIDSLDSSSVLQGPTSVSPTGSTQILQILGTLLQLSRTWYGRENYQVTVTAVIPDAAAASGSITVQQVAIIELIGIATATG